MRRRRGFTGVASAVAAALLVVACTAAGTGSQSSASRDAEATTAPSAAATPSLRVLSFDEAVDAMAATGVAVFDTGDANTEPILSVEGSPSLGYTRWQAEMLVNEVNERNGMRGAALDEAVPLGADVPPLSYLLAAWVLDARTPSATLVSEMMGPQDWERAPQVVFPTLALTLFVADAAAAAARDGGATGTTTSDAGRDAPSSVRPAKAPYAAPTANSVVATDRGIGSQKRVAFGAPDQVGSVCGLVANFVDNSLNWIVGKLTVNPGGGFTGFLGTVWNTALRLAQAGVSTIIGPLTDAVLAPIRIALAAVAVATMVVSYLKPWQFPVRAKPSGRQAYSIDGDPVNSGSFEAEAKVPVGTDQWPADLLACAQGLGISLPELTAAGAPVEWSVQRSKPDAIEVKGTGPPWKNKLDNARKANLEFTTGHEPREWAEKGAPTTASAWVTAKVERKEVTQLTQLVEHLVDATIARLAGPLSGLASAAVMPFVDRLLGAARSRLPSLLHVEGYASLVLDHHKAPDATTTTTAPAPPTVRLGCDPAFPRFEPGSWRGEGQISSELSVGGEVRSTTVTPGLLRFEVTVKPDGTVAYGSWSVVGMVVSIKAGDRNDTATYLGEGILTGRAERLEMGGGFDVQVAGTSMNVPAENYPILPGTCRAEDRMLVGDLTPPADAARQAAGISGGFNGPFEAEQIR